MRRGLPSSPRIAAASCGVRSTAKKRASCDLKAAALGGKLSVLTSSVRTVDTFDVTGLCDRSPVTGGLFSLRWLRQV